MAFFKNLWTFLTETIFLKDERNYRNGLIRWGVRQYKLLFYTARGLDEHDTLVRSAALTFYTLMSIVPIAALVFAVVKGFGLADGLMQNLYSLFPHNREVVDYLITFADKALAAAQGGVVAFVGIVMLFWAVVRVFGSVEEAFNNIWEVKVSRSFTRQFTDYIAVVVITPILWVVGSTAGRYAGHLLGIDSFGALYTLLSGAVSLLVIWAMFSFIYVVVPNTRVRLGSAVMAGIVAGTLFLAFQWGVRLAATLHDLLQCHLRQFRRPAAVPYLGAVVVADSALRRRAGLRLSEHLAFCRGARIAAHQLRPPPSGDAGRHAARGAHLPRRPRSRFGRRDPYCAAAADAHRQRRALFRWSRRGCWWPCAASPTTAKLSSLRR